MPDQQVEAALKALDAFWQRNEEPLHNVHDEFCFEINNKLEKDEIPLPDSTAEAVRNERLRRKRLDELVAGLPEEVQLDFSDIPMMREAREVLAGKWLGKLHWEMED